MMGTADKPRISVHRTNHYTYLQAIDDVQGVTLVAATDQVGKSAKGPQGTKSERATQVASELAADLQKKGVSSAVFDRGRFRYHGRVKTIAEALRAAGLQI